MFGFNTDGTAAFNVSGGIGDKSSKTEHGEGKQGCNKLRFHKNYKCMAEELGFGELFRLTNAENNRGIYAVDRIV
jgi:hypothetical protein